MKYSPGNDKRYWEDHGQNKGWNNEAMGKWAIIQCSDNTLYWCYGDNGDPDRFGSRKGLWLDNRGYIETWSRVFYCYQVDADYDHVASKLGSDNVWKFSSGEFGEYGEYLKNEAGWRISR